MSQPQSHQPHIEPAPLPPPFQEGPRDDEKKDTHQTTHDAVVAPASTAYDRDYADPEVRFESESTHRGEFGTKRDLVSV
jgi:hypothetical protein